MMVFRVALSPGDHRCPKWWKLDQRLYLVSVTSRDALVMGLSGGGTRCEIQHSSSENVAPCAKKSVTAYASPSGMPRRVKLMEVVVLACCGVQSWICQAPAFHLEQDDAWA